MRRTLCVLLVIGLFAQAQDTGAVRAAAQDPAECQGLPVPGSPRTFKFDCNAPIEPTPSIGSPTIILWRVSGTVSLP